MRTLEKDAIILVGIVLILVAGMLFFLGGEEEEIEAAQPGVVEVAEAPEAVEEITEEEFKVDGIQFCDLIDEDFNCDENEDASFKVGQDIYILTEVSGFSQPFENGNYRFGLEERMFVFDPDVELITEASGILDDFISADKGFTSFMQFKINFPTSGYREGLYLIRLEYKDKLTGKDVIDFTTFELR